MEEVTELKCKRRNKINNVNKVVSERPTNESRVKGNCFSEALTKEEAKTMKLNEHMEDLLLDNEDELSTETKFVRF